MSYGNKFMSSLFVLLLSLFTLLPHSAFAYSYGNPNEEAVAENYKQVVAKLNQTPSDFTGAAQTFATIKQELDMHMGTEPSQAIEGALKAEDKDAAISAFQKTLVLNIARRLENVESDFANYQQGKLLLAKGLATYDALSPVVKEKDAALDQKIRQNFEKGLQALGNPGLFGVGVKQPDAQAFKTSKEEILKDLQEFYEMTELKVGHFTPGEGPGNTAAGGSAGMGALKNWLPIVVIVLVIVFIVFRTMRKRRV